MNDTHTHHNNLLLLLAAAPMGMGCIIVADDGNDTTGAETENPPTTGHATGSSTGTDTTPVTSEGTGSTGPSDSTGPEASTGVADSTGPGDTTTGGGSAVCDAYANHAIKCEVPYSEYTLDSCIYQQMSVDMYYPECSTLWEEYVACLSQAACEDILAFSACPDEATALADMGCPAFE